MSDRLIGRYTTEFKVTLEIPKGSITLGSNQMHALSAVLEEARRLKKLSG
jgi:hypothetical protein